MSDGIGETESDASGATPSLPDISDIEGATTGPLRHSDASGLTDRNGTGEPAERSEWAAPTVDGLREAADDADDSAGEPTELLDAVDSSKPPPNDDAPDDPDQTGDAAGPTTADPDATIPPRTAPAEPTVVADPDPTGEPRFTADTPAASAPTIAQETVVATASLSPPAPAPTADLGAEASPTSAPPPKPANPTVSIDAQQVAAATAPSLAVTNAAAMPISGEHAAVGPRPPDPTGDLESGEGPTGLPGGPPSSPPVADGFLVDAGRDPGAAPRPTGKRPLKIALIAVLGLFVLFVGAWLLDSARTSNQVVRNTTLAGTQVGGMGSDELELVIDGLDQALTTAPLTVSVDGTVIETNPAAIGGEVDREAVIDEALSVGRGGSIFGRPIAWVTSFTSERTVEAVYRVDPNRAAEGVAGVVGEALDDPVEPSLELQGSELVLSPGSEGVTVDPAEVAQVLPPALSESNPYAITLTAVATVPTLTDESVQLVVDEASAATQAPAIFQVLDQTAQVESADMRAWVALDTTGQEPTWAINSALAIDGLRPRYPVLGSDEQQARFEVVDGEPVIFPATETVICCDPASVEGIRDALLEPASPAEDGDDEGEEAIRTIVLEPEVVSPDEGVAELETLGIIEEVSTFTTNHACCQNRVTNIQRFADLMRGVIIRPGEDFSLNGHVGRRTTENGFVADGAIANGILEPQVGGGISQFATTFFNASFFAGLDFNEYQSHSLYISRYPRGREATISFPKPDLSVNNATDYGILVWTSYTDTSITVTFYSTKHIDVVAGDLLRSDQGACSRYTTPRIRTYPDGTVAEDSVFAVYRPGEGLDCNGNSTRPEDQPNGPTAPDPQPDTTGPDVTTPEPPPTTEPAGADDDG